MRLTTPFLSSLLCALVLSVVGGCASSSLPADVTPTNPVDLVVPPPGPSLTAVYFDAGLIRHDARARTSTALIPGATFLGPAVASPDGQRMALGYTMDGASHLALLDLEAGTTTPLHTTDGPVVYTAVWSPDGEELAFGYYEGTAGARPQMGAGDLLIAARDGSTRRLGCSVSKAVLAWPEPTRLLVRNADNLYVVDAADCADRAPRIDARRMIEVVPSPDGLRLAYLHRELVIRNRQRSADTTLFVAAYDGTNPSQVASPKYHARNLAWSPDATLLAYDAESQDHPGTRQLFVYQARSAKVSFLTPPDAASQTEAMWSPSSTNFAFTQTLADGTRQRMARGFGTMRVLAEGGPDDRLPVFWGWLNDRTVILRDADGTARLMDLETGEPRETLPGSERLLLVAER